MPGDPAIVTRADLDQLVRGLVADVLAIPADRVLPESRLTDDLGAESIDYVDLLFRLEDALGVSAPPARWRAFLRERLPDGNYAELITTTLVTDFVEQVVGEDA